MLSLTSNQNGNKSQIEILENRKNHYDAEIRKLWKEKLSNIPVKYLEKNLDNFDKEAQPKAFKIVSEYDYKGDKSLMLCSPPKMYGVGKTHLVCALIHKIITEVQPSWIINDGEYSQFCKDVTCPAYYITETELLAKIRATFDNQNEKHETEEQIYKKIESVRILFIDDIGKVKPRDLSFLQGVYFRIIDNRYVTQRPIVIATNLTLTELDSHIGGACSDRLREMCGKNNIVLLSGASYRRNENE